MIFTLAVAYVGPLLYHFADTQGEISVELAYDELRPTFAAFGLKLLKEHFNLPCTYTAQRQAMLTPEYHCVFFVCVKEGEGPASIAAQEGKAVPVNVSPPPPSPSLPSTSSSTATSSS